MRARCPIAAQAVARPRAAAFLTMEHRLSFAEADRCIEQAASRLAAMGYAKGTAVAVLARNSVEYAVLVFALLRLQATCVPLNDRLNEAAWSEALSASRAALLIVDSPLARSLSPASVRVIAINAIVSLGSINEDNVNGDTWKEAPVGVSEHELGRRELGAAAIDERADATIVFTSGSSGKAKGVVLSVKNHLASAAASNRLSNLSPGNIWLLALPLYHVSGLEILFRAALAGATVLMAPSGATNALLPLLKSYHITHISLVGSQLQQLLSAEDGRVLFSSASFILLGGGPMSAQLCKASTAQDLPIRRSYGMTETASHVTCTLPVTSGQATDLAGFPLSNIRVKIFDSWGNVLADGAPGEIGIAGDSVFSCYLDAERHPKRTVGEYFLSGDIGYMDSDGQLHVIGREDGMFISGGENVFPEEIERAAMACKGVGACAVVAIDDALWGKRPLLFVEGEGLDSDAIRKDLGNILPRFKVPEHIRQLKELPRTALGKVDYAALKGLHTGATPEEA